MSWDWWNNLNLRGVSFRAGVNNDTYEYFIDFAAKYGIPYIILDEGWYKLGDLLTPARHRRAGLMRTAPSKNVGVILWATWNTLDDQLQPALDRFRRGACRESRSTSCSATTRTW